MGRGEGSGSTECNKSEDNKENTDDGTCSCNKHKYPLLEDRTCNKLWTSRTV